MKSVAFGTLAAMTLESSRASTAERAEETLKIAQRKANQVRLRLSAFVFTLSAVVTAVSFLIMTGHLGPDPSKASNCLLPNIGTVGMLLGILLMPLGLLPSDRQLINILILSIFMVYVALLFVCATESFGEIHGYTTDIDMYMRVWNHSANGWIGAAIQAWNMSDAQARQFVAGKQGLTTSLGGSLLMFAFFFVIMLAAMAPVLCSRRGCCPLAPREALDRTWLILRVGLSLMHLVFLVDTLQRVYYHPVLYVQGCGIGFFSSDVVHGASWGILPLLATPAVRRRIQAKLMSLTMNAQAKEAATITQLVGGIGVRRALHLARQRFRVIHFDALQELDFASSQDTGCYARAVQASLGSCDVFMSHSWSDSWTAKWETLSEWAAEFEYTTERTPSLWLDKVCCACLPAVLGRNGSLACCALD